MLEGKQYRPVDKMVSFVAAYISWSKEWEKKAPMTRVHTSCSLMVAHGTKEMCQNYKERMT